MLATTLATLALAVAPQLAQALQPDVDSANGGWDQLRIVNKRWQLHTTLASPTNAADAAATSLSAAPDGVTSVMSVAPAAIETYSSAPLNSPPPPADLPDAMTVRVWESADAHVAAGNRLSVRQPSNFLGYSIELSVANQVCEYDIPLRQAASRVPSALSSQTAADVPCHPFVACSSGSELD